MDRQTARSEDGFSILELLVTAGILGVMAAVAIPSFAKSIEAHRLMAGLRTAVNQVRVARGLAIQRSLDAKVNVSQDGHTLQLQSSSDGGTTWVTTGTAVYLDGGVIVSSVSPSNSLRFSRRGLTPSAVTVTLRTTSGASKQFTVSLLGAVEVS